MVLYIYKGGTRDLPSLDLGLPYYQTSLKIYSISGLYTFIAIL